MWDCLVSFFRKKGQMLKKKSLSLFTVVSLEKLIFRQITIVKLCGKSDRNNLCKLSMKTVSEFFRENQIKSGWGSGNKFKARFWLNFLIGSIMCTSRCDRARDFSRLFDDNRSTTTHCLKSAKRSYLNFHAKKPCKIWFTTVKSVFTAVKSAKLFRKQT